MKLSAIPNIWKYVGMGIATLALIAMIIFSVRGCAQDERAENNQLIEIGQTVEREAGQAEVINNVKEANDAVTNPTVNELNVVCDKYDRNC